MMLKSAASLLLLTYSTNSMVSAENDGNLRGGVSRELQNRGNAAEGCIAAAHQFRFAYCDALRTSDQSDWISAAPDFLAPDISTVFGIPGSPNVFSNIDEFLDPEDGFIPALKALIIGDYESCIITFGANARVLSQDQKKITVAMPNTKALSWSDSAARPPFAPGGPGRLLEFDEDEYTCVRVNGKWKIQSYDDPNTLVIR